MRSCLYLLVLATLLLSSCATPYVTDHSGKTAMITYIRDLGQEHLFSEQTGEVVLPGSQVAGPIYSSLYGKVGATSVYLHPTEQCEQFPRTMGSIYSRQKSVSVTVKADVPLVNSYRTEYQTCERHCYKFFYTSSVFTPKENGRYEVLIEPINGVTVYQLENGKREEIEDVRKAPGACRY